MKKKKKLIIINLFSTKIKVTCNAPNHTKTQDNGECPNITFIFIIQFSWEYFDLCFLINKGKENSVQLSYKRYVRFWLS